MVTLPFLCTVLRHGWLRKNKIWLVAFFDGANSQVMCGGDETKVQTLIASERNDIET
jgi:hypothetical protein